MAAGNDGPLEQGPVLRNNRITRVGIDGRVCMRPTDTAACVTLRSRMFHGLRKLAKMIGAEFDAPAEE